jgi:hypothetical protein
MAVDFIKRISDSASLTDILIEMESFIDDLDIYVFKNWFEGELVDGPNVERHWVSMTLKYDYTKMPDPEGGIRLLKYGAIVSFKKAKQEDTADSKQEDIRNINAQYRSGSTSNNLDYALARNKPQLKKIWLVTLKIPRHFIDQLQQMDDLLDDNVDAEHVQAANDADLQAKDAYKDGGQDESGQTQDETTSEVDDQTNSDDINLGV